MRTLGTAVAVAIGFLIAGANPAFAAKGVKKKEGAEVKHGVVVGVVHHKKANAAGHIAEVTVKTKSSKKKGQPAAQGAKTSTQTHKYTIGKETKITAVHGKQQTPAHATALRAGERVTLHVKGEHAESVAIHLKKVKKKA